MSKNKVQEFLNDNFGEVRCLKENNVLWFVAKDISDCLKYATTQKVTDKVDDDDIIKLPKSQLTNLGNWNQTGGKDVVLINEGGLYQVISSITKKDKERYETSREFKRWITNEIIPTIRETGAYIEEEREEEVVEKYFSGLSEDTKKAMVVDLMKNNKNLKVKADIFDNWLDTKSTYTFTETCKLINTVSIEDHSEINISSSKLTEFLRDEGILCKTKSKDKVKSDGTIKKGAFKNLPNKEYEDLFNVVSIDTGSFNKVQTRVKPNGIKFIYEKLKNKAS